MVSFYFTSSLLSLFAPIFSLEHISPTDSAKPKSDYAITCWRHSQALPILSTLKRKIYQPFTDLQNSNLLLYCSLPCLLPLTPHSLICLPHLHGVYACVLLTTVPSTWTVSARYSHTPSLRHLLKSLDRCHHLRNPSPTLFTHPSSFIFLHTTYHLMMYSFTSLCCLLSVLPNKHGNYMVIVLSESWIVLKCSMNLFFLKGCPSYIGTMIYSV